MAVLRPKETMYSIVDYTATADQENFNVTMPYIDQSHIHVYINGVEVDSQFLEFNTPTVVTLTDVDEETPHPAVDEGDTVRVQRTTPIDEAVVDYSNGSNLGESDLDTQTLQLLYIAQEQDDLVSVAIDAAEAIEDSVAFITATAADIEGAIDAAAGSLQAEIEAARDAALAAQTAAELAETNAETAETNAELAETNAETALAATIVARDAALAAQTAAELAEANAETAETNAETAETNAETAETNAVAAKVAAEAARDAALAAQTAAELAETNAETAETNAETAEAGAEAALAEAQDLIAAIEAVTEAGDMLIGSGVGEVGILGAPQLNGQSLVSNLNSALAVEWAGPLMDNPIINGGMDVWQRTTSDTSMASGTFMADRWRYSKDGTTSAVYGFSRSTDVPTVAEAEALFKYSLLLDCNTLDSSIAAGEFVMVEQTIEGVNWKTFAQRYLVLSFWVKATKTGTYCVALRNGGADRSYVAEYTINAANTWEKKTITISPSPSAGTWDYTTSVGVYLDFILAAGSTYQTTPGAWQTGNYLASSNQVNAADSASNTWQVTGVKLEIGLSATPWTFRHYGAELALCQRYYVTNQIRIDAAANTAQAIMNGMVWYKVPMRSNPTLSRTGESLTNCTFNSFQSQSVHGVSPVYVPTSTGPLAVVTVVADAEL